MDKIRRGMLCLVVSELLEIFVAWAASTGILLLSCGYDVSDYSIRITEILKPGNLLPRKIFAALPEQIISI
jgi:hypothetical protein